MADELRDGDFNVSGNLGRERIEPKRPKDLPLNMNYIIMKQIGISK
ncbi:MAG: hypothetical protein WC613_04430 [Candidatus Aenigmatarchaeota archaeon]